MRSGAPIEMTQKAEGAFWSISELAEDLGVSQNILRHWEKRFPALKPVTRAGNRRYYRPEDVTLARQIHRLIYSEGYTMDGARKALAQPKPAEPEVPRAVERPTAAFVPKVQTAPHSSPAVPLEALLHIRAKLVAALAV
jgi:DNA-binding transcriptional MerR regulator